MAAIKGAGATTVSYNAQPITNYVNQADLQAVINELEATHFGSTGQEADPGLGSWQVQIGGDWNSTIDGILGPDAITPAKRTVVVGFVSGATTVTYTWTTNGFITNFQLQSAANGKLVWSATLRLSGVPTRQTA